VNLQASTPVVAGYRPLPDAFDEMVDRRGAVREHWADIGAALDLLGLAELRRRRAEVARLLEDDGVTNRAYARPPGTAGAAGRWALDPVPVLITSGDWVHIENAVIQRAELLNLLLCDLYGPRDLIRRGVLPAELVYGHAGFLRQCDQIRVPGPLQLFLTAVDMARDRDGRFWVLSDRTEAPSGAGYALENRRVVSRVFPSLYRDGQVHRLAPFFRALRSGLQAVAARGIEDPRIVVLTPGAHSDAAFEQALLAAHLGYPLVEGADLAVEGGRVWMRSLGRLEPVDVILRRFHAWYCDPLELRPDSYLGVPGLVEACREGSVSVVNTLGSGVLENPGLLPFFPRLAKHLLGEALELPEVPTWWCGEPAARSHVLANLSRLVVKPIVREAGQLPIFGWQLSSADLDDLRRRIEARPESWVGQEQVGLGSAPTLGEHGLEARGTLLRTFAVANGDAYLAMPGGLTRVAGNDGVTSANQAEGLSKDTWVVTSEPEQLSGYWLSLGPAAVAEPGVIPEDSVSPRAAEDLVWVGRYAERAESVVRLLRVVHDRRNDFADGANPAGSACVGALLAALTQVTATFPGFTGPEAAERMAEPGDELASLAMQVDREGTLAFAVQRLLEAASAARDQLPIDTWLVVSALHRELLDVPSLGRVTLTQVLASLLALAGLGSEMVRNAAWRFMDAGRRIERGIHLAGLLRATVTVEHGWVTDSLLLESVLVTADSIATYRRRYRSHAQLETLLDLLLLDPTNPRSLRFQVDRLMEDLEALPGRSTGGRVSDAERPVLEASTALRIADTAALARSGEDGLRPELDAFLRQIGERLSVAAVEMAAAHFTHQLPQRALATPADPAAARASHGFLP
jgi:uncharacterized circularly permuted ATP-grasp superfamily protein/uncharacterized alpha-E superfamily protein